MHEVAERYSLGQPLAAYRPIFSPRDVVLVIRCLLYLAVFVALVILLIKASFGLLKREDVIIFLLALFGGPFLVYWIIDIAGIFHHLQNVSQQRTFLLVCQEGFLYCCAGHVEVTHWQHFQLYSLTRPGLSRQVTIYRTDGSQFQIDDRLSYFGDFLWRLTCQLTRGRTRENTFAPLPKAFRLKPNSRKKAFFLLLGGVAIGEGILWVAPLSTSPLLEPFFGFLQFLIGCTLFVVLVMFWLRQQLVSKLQIVLSLEGITYDCPRYSLYSPWQNIVDIDGVFPRHALVGLRLRVPVRQDMTVKKGQEQGIAVLEWHRQWLAATRFQVSFPSANMLPIDPLLIDSRRLQDEFAFYLQIYAPQVCNEKGETE